MAHARINVEKAEDVKMFIKSVEDNIMGFHVHWNDGNNDSHLPLKQECMDEIGSYLLSSNRILAEGMPLLFECYNMEENIECLKLLKQYEEG